MCVGWGWVGALIDGEFLFSEPVVFTAAATVEAV